MGTTNPLCSNNNSTMEKLNKGSHQNVKKAANLSTTTQMEGGCISNTQRASRTNFIEVAEVKKIISNHNKVVEKHIFSQSPIELKDDVENAKAI